MAFVGNRKITSGDVQDLLCGPHRFPFHEYDCSRLQAAFQHANQSFYNMDEDILRCKGQDKRIAEAEARAYLWVAASTD